MKRSLKSEQFWFYASLISFAVFYLTLTWKSTKNLDLIVTNSLFWGAIFVLLWRRRKRLVFNSDFISAFLGLLLITLVLIKSLTLYWFESNLFVYLASFISFLGIALIASGIKNIKQYWLEIFFSGFLFIPTTFFGFWFNDQISLATAKISAYLLYYLGFNTVSKGIQILLHLPNQGDFIAEVNYFCTGILMMGLMLKLALLLASFVPMKQWQRFWFATLALAVGFFLGVIRVSILTLTVPNPEQFAFWHGNEGAQIFSTLSIIIFSLFCYPTLNQPKSKKLSQQHRVNSAPILTTSSTTESTETTWSDLSDN
jgi:cyanoexosortase A